MTRATLDSGGRFRALTVGIAATLAVVAAIGASRLMGAGAAMCLTVADGDIVESQQFTPWDLRRSRLPDVAINPSGARLPEVQTDSVVRTNSLDALPLQWAVVGSEGILVRYFWDLPVGPAVTPWAFWEGGGIELDRSFADGWQADEYAQQIGERALLLEVGRYKGVLTWADPGPNGARPHHLSWSDGVYAYTVIADRSPAQIVNMARGMVCG